MNGILRLLKKWLLPVAVAALSIFLVYVAQDYPCLSGAGLALADLEAFIFLVLIGLPSFIWAIVRLLICRRTFGQLSGEEKWLSRLAIIVVLMTTIYGLLAIPVIFSFTRQPLQFICR